MKQLPKAKLLSGNEVVFIAKFFSIFLILEAAINYFGFLALQEFLAKSTAAALGLASSGSIVFIGGGSFEISPSCTGLVSSSVLAAVVFSLRKPDFGKKILIFLFGAVLLLILNYFRVLAVLWAGKEFGIEAGGIVHVVSWFTTTIFVLALWYFFTKKITGAEEFSDFM
ncbi:Transmembrane exosortase (Exosortase_EpsH) [uncultured archaeon]|nr:Transmembrane exosortase (Exosortase_EpsH) [uncultured archaeon]